MHRWCRVLVSWLLLPILFLGGCTAQESDLPKRIETPRKDNRETSHWSMKYATDWEENGTFGYCEFTTFLNGKVDYYTDRSDNPYIPWLCETYFTGPALDRAEEENYRDDLIYEEVIVRIGFKDDDFTSYEERDLFLAEYCAIHVPEAEFVPAIGLIRFKDITFFQLRTLWKILGGQYVRIFIAEEWEYESNFHRTLEEAQELIRQGKLDKDGYNVTIVDGRVIYE